MTSKQASKKKKMKSENETISENNQSEERKWHRQQYHRERNIKEIMKHLADRSIKAKQRKTAMAAI